MIVINHQSYGICAEFGSLAEAQQAIRDCGPEWAATLLRCRGGDVLNERGDIVGRDAAPDQIRYSADGSICMVWRDGEPIRCPTQGDMDRLPVGPDMADDEIEQLDS